MGRAWGAGLILWQLCPHCLKRKMYYEKRVHWGINNFYCSYCKKWDCGTNLIQRKYK